MNTAVAEEVFTINITRTFQAKREAVFDAWVNADTITQWFSPDPSMTTLVDKLEPKTGGGYQFQMINKDGEKFVITGKYVNFNRPEQLIFSWKWITGDDPTEMLVTLDFIDNGDMTELKLCHEKLPGKESMEHHDMGWNGCLVRLEQFF